MLYHGNNVTFLWRHYPVFFSMVWVSLQQLLLHSGSVCADKRCGAKGLNSGFLVESLLNIREISGAVVVPRRDHLMWHEEEETWS